MEPRSPSRIALIVALIAAAAVMSVSVVVVLLSPGVLEWRYAILLAGVVFLTAFLAARVLVKRFVMDRVKLIHRTVQDVQQGNDAELVRSPDPLSVVDAEVSAWARAKRTEITELKEREQFRREFIGNLAHELKTPIFSVQGYILTLLEGGLEDPRVNRDFLNRASNGVDRLIRITEDLDLITQLESGVMAMTIVRMDLHELVQETIETVEMKARAKGIQLRNELEPGLTVRGDRDRLAQVFSNLFNNTINYGTPGGWCAVRSFDLDERVLVEVSDNGIGIAQEHLSRLFERFYRVGKSRARNEGGSGLGLAIVKHIIEAHGQSITVKSTEGQGTTFGFTLAKAR